MALPIASPRSAAATYSTSMTGMNANASAAIAPTTPAGRIRQITSIASGFVYYVSLKGVTGAGHLDVADVAHHLGLIREHSSLPVAVGFGIKDADSARAVAGVADGVVVGSALVAAMARASDGGGDHEAAMAAAVSFLTEIRRGIDHAAS